MPIERKRDKFICFAGPQICPLMKGFPRFASGYFIPGYSQWFRVWYMAGRDVASPVNHCRPLELDHHCAILLEPRGLEAHNAQVGTRFRFALFQDLTARID